MMLFRETGGVWERVPMSRVKPYHPARAGGGLVVQESATGYAILRVCRMDDGGDLLLREIAQELTEQGAEMLARRLLGIQ